MKPHKYIRKPLYVEAVRIDSDNLEEVAKWCEGTPCTGVNGVKYIRVLAPSKLVPRTKAFPGDWVLSGRNGFRVYTNVAFEKSFEQVPEVDGEWPATHEAALKIIGDFDKEYKGDA